jgi:hypothetical protein
LLFCFCCETRDARKNLCNFGSHLRKILLVYQCHCSPNWCVSHHDKAPALVYWFAWHYERILAHFLYF